MRFNRTGHNHYPLFTIALILSVIVPPTNAELVYQDGLLFDTQDMRWHGQNGICEACTLENGFFIPVEELTTDRPGYYFSESLMRWYDRFGVCHSCTPENGFWIPDMYRYAPEYRQEREKFAHLLEPAVTQPAAVPPPLPPPAQPPVAEQLMAPSPAAPTSPPVDQKSVALCEQVLRAEVEQERGRSVDLLFDSNTAQTVPVSSTQESVRGVALLSLSGQRIRIDYDCVVDKQSGRVVQLDRYEGTPLQ